MTYQEKYQELYNAYAEATKNLQNATQKIEHIDGFGDMGELADYFKSTMKYKLAEREFQKLLNYVTTVKLNPASEYVPQEYMYDFIKKDQQKKGIPWQEEDSAPSVEKSIRAYECVISLTNDGEINNQVQRTEYIFPVLNLHHGRECFLFLAEKLQNRGEEGFDANKLKLDQIDEDKQIYIKTVFSIWL